jgi:hypothetical protein
MKNGNTEIPMLNSFIRGSRPIVYAVIVIGAALVALGYHLRVESILACKAAGYGPDRYLAYCGSTDYGEYDHGAFWFGLEPEAKYSARRAKVLFVGNSRTQLGMSTKATSDWFSSRSVSYYLLGFSESERYSFAGEVLTKIRPQASVYVINIDRFFESTESDSAEFVMHDHNALARLQDKRAWQSVHRLVCSAIPALCGDQYAIFRSRQTGAWTRAGRTSGHPEATSDDPVPDEKRVQLETIAGRDFLLHLPVQPGCVILTMVPTVKSKRGTADAIAAGLNSDLVIPQVDGLRTFDGSHLDYPSAERWSEAFLKAAGPRIEKCLSEPQVFESRF